jgi:hypothetical protein
MSTRVHVFGTLPPPEGFGSVTVACTSEPGQALRAIPVPTDVVCNDDYSRICLIKIYGIDFIPDVQRSGKYMSLSLLIYFIY